MRFRGNADAALLDRKTGLYYDEQTKGFTSTEVKLYPKLILLLPKNTHPNSLILHAEDGDYATMRLQVMFPHMPHRWDQFTKSQFDSINSKYACYRRYLNWKQTELCDSLLGDKCQPMFLGFFEFDDDDAAIILRIAGVEVIEVESERKLLLDTL